MSIRMRFGAQTVQQNVSWHELEAFWHFLEDETCVDSIWTMDHFVLPMAGVQRRRSLSARPADRKALRALRRRLRGRIPRSVA